MFVSSVIAYGFARFQFPGRDVLFVILLGTMMIPDQVLIVPRFLLFNLLGWVNTCARRTGIWQRVQVP